jgi:ribosomal protein S18 acetylase RimI-like enzyme
VSVPEGDAVRIRPAEPRDARAFLAFWTAIVAEERFVRTEEVRTPVRAYRRRFRRRSDLEADIVAIDGGRLVGHVSVQRERHPVTRHVASLSIAVAADARGRGIGRRLLDEAIAWATRVGIEKLVLSVYPHNDAAIALYRSVGFVEEGRLARHSRKSYGYEDEILMAAWIGGDG